MSTHDVPGAKVGNADVLAMGCWAEHEDGSLLFVESTEGGSVVYCMFDTSRDPIVEYRDAMSERGFKRMFSWNPKSKDTLAGSVKWTWHDKTPFSWDKLIKAGSKPGVRYAFAEDQLSAAERVAQSLDLRALEYNDVNHAHLRERTERRVRPLIERIRSAIRELSA